MSHTISIRTQVPLTIRESIDTVLTTFHNLEDRQEHIALIFGNATEQTEPLVRVHSSCVTGDIFGSCRCDCGPQLDEAIHRLSQEGGVLLYLFQEGRGIGLYNKIDTYKLQIEQGLDTFAANRHQGFPEDNRDYTDAANMLKALGIQRIRLMTNNPRKAAELRSHDVTITQVILTKTYETNHNRAYLQAKKDMAGHMLKVSDDFR